MNPLQRLLIAGGAIDTVAFVVAFALRHAKHGLGATAGSVAWPTLLTASAAMILLAATALVLTLRGRLRRRPATR